MSKKQNDLVENPPLEVQTNVIKAPLSMNFNLNNRVSIDAISYICDYLYTIATSVEGSTVKLSERVLSEMKKQCFEFVPKTKDEQNLQLIAYGMILREESKTFAPRKNIYKYDKLTFNQVSEAMMSFVKLAKIIDFGLESESIPLSYYDIEDGIYKINKLVLGKFIHSIEPEVTMQFRKEVLLNLSEDVPYKERSKMENIAVLKNCLFDTNTKQVLPFTPDYVFTTKTNAIYPSPEEISSGMPEPVFDNNGKPWTFTQFLNDITNSDESVKYLIKQMMQYSLLTNKAKNAFFILYSAIGRTGKGTLTECLMSLVGRGNTGIADLVQIEDRFGVGSLYNKSMWASNEFDGRFVRSSSVLKNASTGDSISVECKGSQSFEMVCNPLIVQSMNHKPRFGNNLDNSTANRMRVIGFHKTFINEDNTDIKNKFIVSEELNKWLTYNLLNMDVEPITDTEESKILKGDIELDSNPVLQWKREIFDQFESETFPLNLLFRSFTLWARSEGLAGTYKKSTFKSELLTLLGAEWEALPHLRPNKFTESDYSIFLENAFSGSDDFTHCYGEDSIYTPFETYKKTQMQKTQIILKKKA